MLAVTKFGPLALAGALLVGAGCSHHAHESILYQPLVEGRFSARDEPAELATQSPEQLRAAGFVDIGVLSVIRVTSICYETCKKIEHELDCTATLLRVAADHGGDLVSLELDNSEQARPVSKPGECIESYTQYSPSIEFVPPTPANSDTGQFIQVTEPQTVCTVFETVHGTESFQQSAGIVWRKRD